MECIVNLLIVLITAIVVFILLLRKKTSWYNALFFGVFVLFALLFLFKKEMTLRWSSRVPTPVYLLVDRSHSVSGKVFPPYRTDNPRYKVLYFADTLSEKTNGLNPEYTSLHDSIRTLRKTAGDQAKIIVFSDFLDNNSMNGFEKTAGVYPVLPARQLLPPDYFSLVDVRIPDYFETGEPVDLTVVLFSSKKRQFELKISDGARTILRKPLSGGSGYLTNRLQWQVPAELAGNRILTFTVRDASGGQTADPAVRKSVEGLSGMQKILLVSGRPSEEYVFLKRFLEKIRWLKTDAVLSVGGKAKIGPELLDRQKYNAVILMDLAETAATGDLVKKTRTSGISVFYQPGPKNFDEIGGLVRIFTNVSGFRGLAERKFRYDNNDLIVLSGLESDNPLIECSSNARIFFGWNSWKWDFIRLREDIAYNDYESFWQNQINFLLNSQSGRVLPVRLNYVFGDPDIPVSAGEKTGLYSFRTNGSLLGIQIGHFTPEAAPLPPDPATASLYQTNFAFADEIRSLPEWIENIRGSGKVSVSSTWSVRFSENPFAFAVMIISLLLFWIFRDHEETTR